VRRSLTNLTEGERSFVLAHLATALFGAGAAFAAVMRMGQGAIFAAPLTAYDLWIVLSGAIGGALGLYLNRQRIGQAGSTGLIQAFGAIVMSNVTGAVICGTLALPLYGTMFGPFTLIMILIGSPLVSLIWLANQVAAHLLLAQYHAERDSIFVAAQTPASLKRGLA
jgi:hypothetical protein